jgi:hypothetical protein
MKLENITIVTHTHSDCSELWGPYFDSYTEFFNHDKHIVLNNTISDKIKLNQFLYTDILFSDRILNILKNINTKYVIISLEDMILCSEVDSQKIREVIDFCDNENADFFRLIKSGISTNTKIHNNYFKIENEDWLFSVTPTIWNIEFLIYVLNNNKNLNIWNLEVNANNFLKQKNIKGFYYFNNERKVGGHHDSSIYPHICSAILKGKWNTSEYKNEITYIAKKYNIDLNVRGEI